MLTSEKYHIINTNFGRREKNIIPFHNGGGEPSNQALLILINVVGILSTISAFSKHFPKKGQMAGFFRVLGLSPPNYWLKNAYQP